MKEPRYPQVMEAPQPLHESANADLERDDRATCETPGLGTGNEDLSTEVTKAIQFLKYSFFNCYRFQEERLEELVNLLREAESRGIVVTEAVGLADTSFWLQWIANQLTYLDLLLRFATDPGPKNLRALIQMHGPDRKRAKAQVEILEEQLKQRIARFKDIPPDEAFALIRDNRGRVLAAYLHVRAGYGGTDLAAMFKVPTGTAYEWLRWFDRLPEGLREAALKFIDREGFMMVVNMPPMVTKGHAQKGGRQSA